MNPASVTETAPLLRAHDVTRRFGAQLACDRVNLSLYPGEVLGIVGESGSGKTTLLHTLAGMHAPDAGHVLFSTRHEGVVDLYALSEARRTLLSRTDWGFVHQHARDGLHGGVSAGANVGERLMAVGARHYGQIRKLAQDWLARVEIDAGRIDDLPKHFSGGMQQRLQIARNLVTQPRIELIHAARERSAAIVGIFHDEQVRQAVATRLFHLAPVQPLPAVF